MVEILTADRIRHLRDCCSSGATVTARQIALMADSHEELRACLESARSALREVKRRCDIGRSGNEARSGPIGTNGFPVDQNNCWCNECLRQLVETTLGAADGVRAGIETV